MSFYHSPRIVTNGLVLCLDAGNTKSYTSGSLIWNDLSGRGITGSLSGSTPPSYTGSNGGGLMFDGATSYVNLPVINFTDRFTVSGWVYIKNSSWNTIIGNWQDSGGGDSWLLVANGQYMYFYTRDLTGTQGAVINDPIIMNLNIWYNYTATFNQGQAIIYRNGVEAVRNNYVYTSVYQNLLNAWVGRFQTFYMNGCISQVSLYNRALSASEVLQNYNAMKGRYNLS